MWGLSVALVDNRLRLENQVKKNVVCFLVLKWSDGETLMKPKKGGSKDQTGEQIGEQNWMNEAETYCLCGFQEIIQVTPAHHMQIQGRSLASSKRPFSLEICGLIVDG